ncbi:MAG TPA: GNAT family N-acetyltransferase [Lysobacter sp.]
MTPSNVDPSLVLAWQVAHSIARGSPAPVHDREGYRVDTGSESEVKRWIFPTLCEGVRAVGREITAPRHYVKVCVSDELLRGALPARWQVEPPGFFMTTAVAWRDETSLPDGYRMELHHAGPVTRARIISPDGDVAASGCAAESADVFIYDRIATAHDHRRKGLGIAVMSALASARRSTAARQLLSATEDGRKLYEKLGWTVLAPLATAAIVEV